MSKNGLENKKVRSHWINSFNPLKIAAVSSLGLAVVKIVTFFLTGSLVVLSSFLDSIEDAIISFINTKIQKLSKEKPDKKHPFGHGGIEVLSGLIQASIIFAFGLVIMIEALGRISRTTSFLKQENLMIGFIVLVIGAVFGFILNWFLKVAEKRFRENNDHNISISTDRAHYEGDFWFNCISAIGMGLVWWTGIGIIDSICAIIAASFFIKATFPVFVRTYKDITNQEVDAELQEKIKTLIYDINPNIKDVHDLRSRLLGPSILIDCHIYLPDSFSVVDSYKIVDQIKKVLYDNLNIDAMIHVDPVSLKDHLG